MTDIPADDAVPASNDCIDGLRALAQGDYTSWRGLGPDCHRAAVAQALGAPATEQDMVGHLGGSPTGYRVYPETVAAPSGVFVWFVDQDAVYLRIQGPAPPSAIRAQLGDPEAELASQMPGYNVQWVYASRGLSIHLDPDSETPSWLYAFAPTRVEEFEASWMSKSAMRRTPRGRRLPPPE
jgi:hypothetical protein